MLHCFYNVFVLFCNLCLFFMLKNFHFVFWALFMYFCFRLSIFMLQLVALFSCYSFFVLHFHNIKKYWKWTKEKTRAEKQKGRKFCTFCNWKAVALNLYFMNIGVCAKHFISTWKKQFLFLQILMFVITRFWCFISLVFGYQWNTKIFSSLIIIINVCRAQTCCTFMLHFF